jgi:hypothetical protein
MNNLNKNFFCNFCARILSLNLIIIENKSLTILCCSTKLQTRELVPKSKHESAVFKLC